MSDEDIDDDLDEGEGEEESDGEEESGGQKFGWKKILLFACQRRSKTSPPGRSKTSPLNVMRYAVLGGSCGPTGSTIAPAVKQVFLGISAVFGFG